MAVIRTFIFSNGCDTITFNLNCAWHFSKCVSMIFLFVSLKASLDMDGVMHLSTKKLHHINSILILVEELCNHDKSLRVKLAMTFQAQKLNSLLKLIIGGASINRVQETFVCSLPEVSIDR